jgi:hypothetical protein
MFVIWLILKTKCLCARSITWLIQVGSSSTVTSQPVTGLHPGCRIDSCHFLLALFSAQPEVALMVDQCSVIMDDHGLHLESIG